MEHGVLGDHGAHAMPSLERRKEQDTVITHHLKMEVPHVLALQVRKITAEVTTFVKIFCNSLLLWGFI